MWYSHCVHVIPTWYTCNHGNIILVQFQWHFVEDQPVVILAIHICYIHVIPVLCTCDTHVIYMKSQQCHFCLISITLCSKTTNHYTCDIQTCCIHVMYTWYLMVYTGYPYGVHVTPILFHVIHTYFLSYFLAVFLNLWLRRSNSLHPLHSNWLLYQSSHDVIGVQCLLRGPTLQPCSHIWPMGLCTLWYQRVSIL